MATSAPSPLASSVEKANGAKLSRLLIDGGTTVLRQIFDGHHHPGNLITDLNANYSILNKLLRRRVLNRHQWDKLFPPGGVAPDSKTFDITLLFLLLTNICGLTPPLSGWHALPPLSDTSHEANLARVKFYRNVLYGHVTTTGVDTPTFSALWTEISGVLVSLGLDQTEADRLKAEKGGEQDYIDVLYEWADSEEDIKSQFKNLHQSHTKTQQSVEEVCQTVEEVLQTQTLTKQNVEEVAVGLQAVKETINSLKEEKYNDRDNEVLRNLAKSDFKGDIEYYVKIFQEGTREWVFNSVQNWIDDRSSQNRVMVISGNAGMGKSVIAAVICKRMQQAGRLSGSHFCQYKSARYSKPQLMLQSLAFHLSNTLPEYKQALVEQLSRNLGTDLNNMGVEELFALLFKEPLITVGDPGRSMLMVIDGLDESEYQGRNEILLTVEEQFKNLPTWIRFLVTTRPATNIIDKLKHLRPLELRSNDQRNLEDIKLFFLQQLQHVIKEENFEDFVERLVLKSEGLMLYAHFLILAVKTNTSLLKERDLDGERLGISSVYHSYFKRLENELVKELGIKELHFLNLVSAVTASREPLPVGFLSKLLVPGTNSNHAKRKVRKALDSVSALLPIRDGCLHLIHKSVKDWLTDGSCFGEHEYITDENDGHHVLAALCIDELSHLKWKGVQKMQFSATEIYALYHGAHHMLHKGDMKNAHEVDELTKAYIIDLEIMYAKTCINSTMAAEDLLWLQKQRFSTMLSEESQGILDTMLLLSRKFLKRITANPHTFLQTMLNDGGKVLSLQASNLLQTKYHEVPYMENVSKKTQQDCVLARFLCSDFVACFDVSPQLNFMVCECCDGNLQLWSLRTGRLVWTRPVVVRKVYNCYLKKVCRKLPSANALSFFRSVAFHPSKECVLPGILSQAYTMDGDLKPLFPGSNCRFSVCSISGDKTKILTNCLESSKCLVLWSLENGSEVGRIYGDEDILSFAWSRDGRLLAMSHSSGEICLVDMMRGFKKLSQTVTTEMCGMIKFSPDHRFLFCCHLNAVLKGDFFSLSVDNDDHDIFSLGISSCKKSYNFQNFACLNASGFLFGDTFSVPDGQLDCMTFVLDEECVLRCESRQIDMVDIKKEKKTSQGGAYVAGIALSLDGKSVYVASYTSVTTWDVELGKLKAKINFPVSWWYRLCSVRRGVLISKSDSTIELWSHDLSECMKRWTEWSGITEMIPLSEERVAVVRECEVAVLDTNSGKSVTMIGEFGQRVITCNSKYQLLTMSHSFDSLHFLDGRKIVWKRRDNLGGFVSEGVSFSPKEQFLIVWTIKGLLVLDVETGKRLSFFGISFCHCKFISDDRCVISRSDLTVRLLDVISGEILSAIEVKSRVTCLAAYPFNHLVAIGLENSTPTFKIIRVHLPRSENGENGKR